MRRYPLAVLALVVLALASAARADVDLSGNWLVEYDFTSFGMGIVTTNAVLTQTGTQLTFNDVEDDMSGTIDPTTGVFHVEGDPTEPSVPFPAGPPPERNGEAENDGMRFSGILRLWALTPHAIWLNFDFPMIGARPELVVCGNGIRDPGERCDEGAQNGVGGCCDATCAFVDPNRTEPCGDGTFAVTHVKLRQTGKLPDASRIAVKGMLLGPGADTIGGVTSFRVTYLAGDTIVTNFTCTRKNAVLQCLGIDKIWQLKLVTTRRGTKLGFTMKPAGLPLPLDGPVTVRFVDDLAIAHTAAALTNCKATSSTLSCAP